MEGVIKQGNDSESNAGCAVSASVMGWNKEGACLKDARDCITNSFTKSSRYENSDFERGLILAMDGDNQSIATFKSRPNEIGYGARRSSTVQNKVIIHTAERKREALFSQFQPIDYVADPDSRVSASAEEDGNKAEGAGADGSTDEGKSSSLSSGAGDVHAETTKQNFEYDRRHFQTLKHKSLRPNYVNNHKRTGKENSYFIWQKTGKNIGHMQTHGRKSNNDYLWKNNIEDNEHLPLRHTFISRDVLWQRRKNSGICDQDGLLQRRKNSGISDQESDKTGGCGLADSHAWTVQQSFSDRFNECVPRFGDKGNITWLKSRDKLPQPFKQQNFNHCKRGFWVSKTNSYNVQSKLNHVHSDALVPKAAHFHTSNVVERSHCGNYPLRSISFEADEPESLPFIYTRSSQGYISNQWTWNSDHQELLHEIKPHAGMRILTTKSALGEPAYGFFDDEDRSAVSSDIEFPCHSTNKGILRSQKWGPTSEKKFLIPKVKGNFGASNVRKINAHEGTDFVVRLSNDMIQCNMPCNFTQRNGLGVGETDYSSFDNKLKSSSAHFCSQQALRVLNAAYRSQIASETICLAAGSPVAEFERLLSSASPVVVPSFFCQHREFVSKTVLNALNKFQNCDFLLGDVWNWYERHGNYGLGVEAENSQSSKGMETNVVFNAYFVPLLSAVQLFGRSQHSLVGRNTGNLGMKMPQFKAKNYLFPFAYPNLSCPIPAGDSTVSDQLISGEKGLRRCNLATSNGNGYFSSTSALCFSDDSEVIFEFFEHEPPQQRKPLHLKIKELVEADTPNSLVFGDSSKLECTSLHDLHPASWFSVAWYPIYQIPEGSFRAAFLTYHSLGHFVVRPKSNSVEELYLVFPALGMQSYNTQGECWLRPKKFAGYLPKDGMSFDSSEILKERLRTLEETAVFFARGSVNKNNIRTSNRHPDYEFFLTRRL